MNSNKANYQREELIEVNKVLDVCRDFYNGGEHVVNEKYIHQSGLEIADSTYTAYQRRLNTTPFMNMFSNVIDAVSAIVTREPPVVEKEMAWLDLNNIDGSGNNLHTFIKQVCFSSVLYGVCFIAVQKGSTGTFLKIYKYADLINYIYNNDPSLRRFTFIDKSEIPEPDSFAPKKIVRYEVYEANGGSVWYINDNTGELEEDKTLSWTNDVDRPLVVTVRTGKELAPMQYIPKFYDIALLNKVLVNLESWLCNVLALASNPIPVMYGSFPTEEDGNQKVIRLSTETILSMSNKGECDFRYTEIQGTGLGCLENKITAIREDIDKISFGVLVNQTNRTVIDSAANTEKNRGFLTNTAIEIEDKFNRIFEFCAMLNNKTLSADERVIKLEKSFDDVAFNEQQFTILNNMLSSGNISREVVWGILVQNGVLPEDFDVDEENKRLDAADDFDVFGGDNEQAEEVDDGV